MEKHPSVLKHCLDHKYSKPYLSGSFWWRHSYRLYRSTTDLRCSGTVLPGRRPSRPSDRTSASKSAWTRRVHSSACWSPEAWRSGARSGRLTCLGSGDGWGRKKGQCRQIYTQLEYHIVQGFGRCLLECWRLKFSWAKGGHLQNAHKLLQLSRNLTSGEPPENRLDMRRLHAHFLSDCSFCFLNEHNLIWAILFVGKKIQAKFQQQKVLIAIENNI